MRRSISNPRIVLPALCGAVFLWSVFWAYVERPRIRAGFGAIGGAVDIHGSEIKNVKVQSASFRHELEARLNSAKFTGKLRAIDKYRPPLFADDTSVAVHADLSPGLDPQPFATELSTAVIDAWQGHTLLFVMSKSGDADLSVMYLYATSYGIEDPASSWLRWLQARLPGMPDRTRLSTEADVANKAVKDGIERQVRVAARNAALSAQD